MTQFVLKTRLPNVNVRISAVASWLLGWPNAFSSRRRP